MPASRVFDWTIVAIDLAITPVRLSQHRHRRYRERARRRHRR
jgi:hypothetical protein